MRRNPAEVDGRSPVPREGFVVKDEDTGHRRSAGRRKTSRGHRGHGHRGHHHRHHYGCGHYGYGSYGYDRYGYDRYGVFGYDPFFFGFGYFSPAFYWDLGYWQPEVHVYGGGGGSYERYDEVGQGALDLNIRPKTAEVYVDGAYVGMADQLDGYPIYLWLEEGTYEVAFYKQGYETIFRRYTIYPGVTINVDDHMRPGEAILPIPPTGAYPSTGAPSAGIAPGANDGRLAIVATPGDAAVYLDGHFVGTAAEISDLGSGLIIEPGDHLVEIIRPGYENQRVPISVAAGELIDLQLDLRRP